jgi:electron transport complex protein RnfB
VLPLDPACGTEKPVEVAIIDESLCIGCTLCIQACPVDAIVGAAKRMHTVLLDECTGCELCVAPCPVDCIAMRPVEALRAEGYVLASRPPGEWRSRADRARTRMHARTGRLARERQDRDARLAAKAAHKLAALTATDDATQRKRAIVEAAIARAKARRTAEQPR